MQEMGMKLKHLGVVARPERLRNTCENHETWHGVMTWHQHAALIFLAELGQALL